MSYNLKRIIKRIFYCLVTKKMLLSIIIALLIFILLKTNVLAYTYQDIEILPLPTEVQTAFDNIPISNKDDYYYFVICNGNAFGAYFTLKSTATNFKSYATYDFSHLQWLTRIYYTTPSAVSYREYNYNISNPSNGFTIGSLFSNQTNFNTYNRSIDYNSFKIYFLANFDVYTDNTYTTKFYSPEPPTPTVIDPYITNTDLELTKLSGTYLTVEAGNQSLLNNNIDLYITTRPRGSYNGTLVYATGLNYDSEFYNDSTPGDDIYDIPISIFKDYLTPGYEISYEIRWRTIDHPERIESAFKTLVYDPDAETVDDIELLNNNISTQFTKINQTLNNGFSALSEQEQAHFIQQYEQQQQTQDYLMDDNFSTSNLDLPTSNINDITANGINNIFTMIYNAFCSGQAQDINFPIPFTGKYITIPYNYTISILNNTQFSFVKNIIELFWWYLISAFIVKDIANKMNKAKSGDFENLENSNIKEDMLW